jgi:hypothetical protein
MTPSTSRERTKLNRLGGRWSLGAMVNDVGIVERGCDGAHLQDGRATHQLIANA